MANESNLVTIGWLLAGADLSSHQYGLVMLSGATWVKCSAITDQALGILQNKPTSGLAATVAVGGVSKCKLGASVTAGTSKIGPDANGAGIPKTDATHWAIGVALESVTLAATPTGDELASVLINGPFHAANAS